MTFEDAQKDMNTSYCGGGTGVLASGVIWCLAGIVALKYSYQSSMLMIIGVRYLIFNTLYGTKVYWILGALLMISGALCIYLASDFVIGAFIGAALEIVFAVVILNQSKNLHLKIT
ncbi:DUF7010 family protein [Pseudoalteromonas lipolytica]|uniref:Uncharacterized protein n=1 Tax=Pseudoalteromonas lipolytica TaxID=570156 RepID=A0ABY1GBS0_9GAMM|nr:hypothetical protein [Pseudoalteromonas lipolytica]MBE0350936.1 hypothetical protein [Pseudoalteromonas lipolytica LMEB 39]SFT32550.1 hypothetical protein SAMN04487854_10153 [Pseudoalteromonas lipolytica]